MTRPVALDVFCAGGGASMGYHRAGFEVIGSDLEAQPRYPFEFVRADALELLADTAWLRRRNVVLIGASPPCFVHSDLSAMAEVRARGYVDLVPDTRAALIAAGLPYVIENVERAPLIDPIILCGSMFDLGADCSDGVRRYLKRHRKFESNLPLTVPGPCAHDGQPIGVYGGGGTTHGRGRTGRWSPTREYTGVVSEKRAAMGIDWLPRSSLNLAIPPAYTEWIGRQVIQHLRSAA